MGMAKRQRNPERDASVAQGMPADYLGGRARRQCRRSLEIRIECSVEALGPATAKNIGRAHIRALGGDHAKQQDYDLSRLAR